MYGRGEKGRGEGGMGWEVKGGGEGGSMKLHEVSG